MIKLKATSFVDFHQDDELKIYPMNPEAKTKWLQALRSGEYNQCFDALHKAEAVWTHREGVDGYEDLDEDWNVEVVPNSDAFCCLGVLLDANGEHWGEPARVWDDTIVFTSLGGYEFLDALNDFDVQSTVQEYLAHLNDIHTPFNDIADWIEENL